MMELMFCACLLSMPLRLLVYDGELEYVPISQSCATGVQQGRAVLNSVTTPT